MGADKRRRRAVVALGENPLGRRIYDPAGFDVGGGRWRDRLQTLLLLYAFTALRFYCFTLLLLYCFTFRRLNV